jgi:general nucleoside transport system permease protein
VAHHAWVPHPRGGAEPDAARYAGIKVQRYVVLALLLSGAFSGLAGATQVYGVNYRMITDGSATGFTGSAGFNGIVAALFGQLHPIWSIPASILFGALLVGANKMQRVVQVPSALVIALNGLVVVFVVSSEIWRRRRQRQRLAVGNDQDGAAASQEKTGQAEAGS